MHKYLVLLLLFTSSLCFAGYTPDVELSIGNDKAIYVTITNDSTMDLECKYSVSWFINRLTYRKEYGSMSMSVGSVTQLVYKNDQYARLSNIKTKVDCQ